MVTFNAVKDTMRDMGAVTYNVKGPRGALIGYNHDSKVNVEEAINKIEKLLNETSGTVVTIELNPRNGKGGDNFKIIKLEVDLNTVRKGGAVSGAGDDITFNKYHDELKKKDAELLELKTALIRAEHKKEIEDLKKEIAGIRDNDTVGKLLETLTPVLVAYLPKMLNPGAPAPMINGIVNISEREDLLNRWANADPDYLNLLGVIVRIAEQSPANYQQYKPILIAADPA